MGASLYIGGWSAGKINSKDNYFRDSYNGTNVLWTLNLSWWRDVSEKLLNKKEELRGRKLVQFRDMVVNAKQILPDERKLREMGCAVGDGEDSVESWHKYYTEKRQQLIDFLNRAIETKTFIDCSL